MLTEKEKDELYEEFKARLDKDQIIKRRNVLSEIREKHIKRWMQLQYGDDAEKHYPVPAAFTGWDKITGFVAKALYSTNIWRVGQHPGMEELAVKMAEELSDLYFKYAEQSWVYDIQDMKGEKK